MMSRPWSIFTCMLSVGHGPCSSTAQLWSAALPLGRSVNRIWCTPRPSFLPLFLYRSLSLIYLPQWAGKERVGKKSLAGRCARGTSALFIITMTTEYVRRVRSCQSTHQKETRGQSGGAWESLASVPERTLNHFQPGVCVCVREFTEVVCSEALHSV